MTATKEQPITKQQFLEYVVHQIVGRCNEEIPHYVHWAWENQEVSAYVDEWLFECAECGYYAWLVDQWISAEGDGVCKHCAH